MTETNEGAGGFKGSVTGLGLADMIQLNTVNRFSGCISVQHGADTGRIFFQEGKIIHAEQGGASGQEAFFQIMAWRSGRFDLEPGIATVRRSIDANPQHLLLEAHRMIDERRAGMSMPPAPSDARFTASHPPSLVERLQDVPNVAYAVRVSREGACIDDSTSKGEALAGKIAYLAMVGGQLGDVLGLGQVSSAVVHGKSRHMLLQAGERESFGLSIEGGEVAAVELEARKVLGSAV